MSAYIIAFLEVSDKDRYAEYTKVTPGIIAQYGGKFIARGGKTETLEGPRGERRVVLLKFPPTRKPWPSISRRSTSKPRPFAPRRRRPRLSSLTDGRQQHLTNQECLKPEERTYGAT